MKRIRRALATWIVVGLLLLLVAVVTVRKALLLSADPAGDKHCPPLVPASAAAGGSSRSGITTPAGLTWAQRGGTLDDASCLDSTPVFGVVQVRDLEDVRRALQFARDNGLTVSAAGVRHSMGGQALARNGIVLDMTRFNRMSLDAAAKVLTVQSGLVVGGYGLFGVILDADLEVTDNAIYRSERRIVATREFPALFEKGLAPDRRLALMYAHLSTAPPSFLDEALVYGYREVDGRDAPIPPLGEVRGVRLRRLVFNLSKYGGVAMRLKWFAEKHVEPRLESCPVSQNQALGEGEACFVPRNQPMHDSVKYLKNESPRGRAREPPQRVDSCRAPGGQRPHLRAGRHVCRRALPEPDRRRRRQRANGAGHTRADRPDGGARRHVLPALPAPLHPRNSSSGRTR